MFVSICNIVRVYISSLCPHDEGNLGNGVTSLGKLRDFKVRCKPACFCTKKHAGLQRTFEFGFSMKLNIRDNAHGLHYIILPFYDFKTFLKTLEKFSDLYHIFYLDF